VFPGLRALFGGKNRRYAKKKAIKPDLPQLLLEDYSENRDFFRSRLT
jgi:hypothetical protein